MRDSLRKKLIEFENSNVMKSTQCNARSQENKKIKEKNKHKKIRHE